MSIAYRASHPLCQFFCSLFAFAEMIHRSTYSSLHTQRRVIERVYQIRHLYWSMPVQILTSWSNALIEIINKANGITSKPKRWTQYWSNSTTSPSIPDAAHWSVEMISAWNIHILFSLFLRGRVFCEQAVFDFTPCHYCSLTLAKQLAEREVLCL